MGASQSSTYKSFWQIFFFNLILLSIIIIINKPFLALESQISAFVTVRPYSEFGQQNVDKPTSFISPKCGNKCQTDDTNWSGSDNCGTDNHNDDGDDEKDSDDNGDANDDDDDDGNDDDDDDSNDVANDDTGVDDCC